jgi:hypothetical protein
MVLLHLKCAYQLFVSDRFSFLLVFFGMDGQQQQGRTGSGQSLDLDSLDSE